MISEKVSGLHRDLSFASALATMLNRLSHILYALDLLLEADWRQQKVYLKKTGMKRWNRNLHRIFTICSPLALPYILFLFCYPKVIARWTHKKFVGETADLFKLFSVTLHAMVVGENGTPSEVLMGWAALATSMETTTAWKSTEIFQV